MHTILTRGQLNQKISDSKCREKNYVLGLLDEKHLAAIMALQAIIVQHLSHPDMLQAFSYEFMKQHLGHRGMVLGIMVEDRLVAFRNIYYPSPRDDEWNLGIDLGLPAAELPKVANLQMICVHPQFRGNALGRRMNRISLDLLRTSKSRYHVCATVSPDNIWNIPILLKNGFGIAKLTEKYGGKKRYVVYQNLREPVQFDHASEVYVRLNDLSTQATLLRCGLIGVAQQRTRRRSTLQSTGDYHLVFKSPRHAQNVKKNLTQPLRRIQF